MSSPTSESSTTEQTEAVASGARTSHRKTREGLVVSDKMEKTG